MTKPADTAERLYNLILMLRNAAEPMTFEKIRIDLFPPYPNSFEAARQAFERDKKAIRLMGVNIDQVTLGGEKAGTMAYRIDAKKNELPDLGLNSDELSLLRMALGMLSIDGAWTAGALDKFGAEIDLGDDSSAGSMVIDLHAPMANLPIVVDASAKRTVLEFTYNGKARSVHPYAVLARAGHWYVIAHDPSVEELRRFRLDRIESPKASGAPGAFSRPAGFVARDHMPDDPKLMNDDPDAQDHTAVVLVDASLAKLVEREYGPSAVVERAPNGDAKFRVPCANRWAFRSWVLSMMDRAEVLEPASVRAEVVDWLKAVAK